MFFKVLRDIAKPQWFDIINCLKRSTGLSVAELSESLGMSYMGIKQHCVELHKRGYLDTWRRPKAVGRPEKAYRLTAKAEPLFPQMGNDFTNILLETVEKTYGAASGEKLLFGFFQELGQSYRMKLKGDSLSEKVSQFTKIRESEGYVSSCEIDNSDEMVITEYHSPYQGIIDKYPMIHNMEDQMIGRVLGANVVRNEEKASGLVKYTFLIR